MYGAAQAQQYELGGNKELEYQAYFQFASLLLDTIPKHRDYGKLSASVLSSFRDINRNRVMPRLEALKPQLASIAHRAPVRAGTSQIQASNLSSIDWAAARPALPAATALPAYYIEQNPTVGRQLDSIAGRAAAVPAAEPGDPFAASTAFAAPSASPAAAAPIALAGLPALPAGASCRSFVCCHGTRLPAVLRSDVHKSAAANGPRQGYVQQSLKHAEGFGHQQAAGRT